MTAMTREEQIAEALAVLEPSPDKIAVCRRDIEMMLGWMGSMIEARTKSRIFASEKGKDGLRSYKNALEKHALPRRAKVHPAIRPWLRANIEGEIALVKELLDKRAQPKRDAVEKKAAAAAAHNLLVWWGHRPTSTRGGKWDKLAKALAGIDAAGPSLTDHLKSSNCVPLIRVRDRNGSVLLINNSEEARGLLQKLSASGFLSPVGIRPQPSKLRKGAKTRRKGPAR